MVIFKNVKCSKIKFSIKSSLDATMRKINKQKCPRTMATRSKKFSAANIHDANLAWERPTMGNQSNIGCTALQVMQGAGFHTHRHTSGSTIMPALIVLASPLAPTSTWWSQHGAQLRGRHNRPYNLRTCASPATPADTTDDAW